MPLGQVISVNTYYARELTLKDLEHQSYGQVISANVILANAETVVKVSQNSFVDANDWFNLSFGTLLSFDLLGEKPIHARIVRPPPEDPPEAMVDDGEDLGVDDDTSVTGEVVMSEYETDSEGYLSEEEFKKLGGRRSSKVFSTYSSGKKQDHDKINTQSGLNQAVKRFDTGKNSGANTNLLYQGPDEEAYTLYQKGTALGVGLYAQRFKKKTTGVRIKLRPINAQAKWGKTKNVHTEMHLLWLLTGGKKEDIPGIMEGGRLIVDKPICWDCYQYVKSAGPEVLRDGYEGREEDRERWAKWTDPFGLTPLK